MVTDSMRPAPTACPICGGDRFDLIETARSKPPAETDFQIKPDEYFREILQCRTCGVYVNRHQLLSAGFYEGNYNRSTYADQLAATFERIMSLPVEASDNAGRTRRVSRFLEQPHFPPPSKTRILDVGSGLCVFLAAMKKLGFHCSCVDPDPAAIEHALTKAGVDKGFAVDFKSFETDTKFDLVTFNKVLEHVPDPVGALRKGKNLLAPEGFVYAEVPDGENALRNGAPGDREEFYIEHVTVFTVRAMEVLAEKAGFSIAQLEQIHEPSDKYTIACFLKPKTS